MYSVRFVPCPPGVACTIEEQDKRAQKIRDEERDVFDTRLIEPMLECRVAPLHGVSVFRTIPRRSTPRSTSRSFARFRVTRLYVVLHDFETLDSTIDRCFARFRVVRLRFRIARLDFRIDRRLLPLFDKSFGGERPRQLQADWWPYVYTRNHKIEKRLRVRSKP